MSDFLTGVRARAAALARRVVLPEGTEERTQAAAARLQREGLVEPILLGAEAEVRRGVTRAEGDGDAVLVLDPARDPRGEAFAAELHALRRHKGLSEAEAAACVVEPLFFGALLVRAGEAHGSVAGAVNPTGDVIRAALQCVGTAPGIRTISSSFYMVVPPFRGEGEEVLT
ncbi:MAG TPA: phosphate acyltransferase, partial [Longimicrobiales bacterium]|nr:phosphate acyltransferase [Longimicrobiales bacterium]